MDPPTQLASQRVFGFYPGLRARRGSVAELATIAASHVAAIDDALDPAVAAATPLAMVTERVEAAKPRLGGASERHL